MAKRTSKKTTRKSGLLTAAQERFCKHYALHRNGTAAVRHVWPHYKSKPDQRAAVRASQLLSERKVSERVEQLAGKVAKVAEEKFEISVEKVVQELACIGFYNAEDYFEWGTMERPVWRKDRDGKMERVLDENGDQVTETVPFARLKDQSDLTRRQKAAILTVGETITRTGDRMIETKMADKVGALKLIGQHLGMFKMGLDAQVAGKGGGAIMVVVQNAEANL